MLRFFHFRAAQVAQIRAGHADPLLRHAQAGQTVWRSCTPATGCWARRCGALGDELDPVYPTVEGISPASMRKLIGQALDRLPRMPRWNYCRRTCCAACTCRRCVRPCWACIGPPAIGSCRARDRHPPGPAFAWAWRNCWPQPQSAPATHRLAATSRAGPRRQGKAGCPTAVRPAVFTDRRAATRVRRDPQRPAQPSPMLSLVQGDVGSGKHSGGGTGAILAVEAASRRRWRPRPSCWPNSTSSTCANG